MTLVIPKQNLGPLIMKAAIPTYWQDPKTTVPPPLLVQTLPPKLDNWTSTGHCVLVNKMKFVVKI